MPWQSAPLCRGGNLRPPLYALLNFVKGQLSQHLPLFFADGFPGLLALHRLKPPDLLLDAALLQLVLMLLPVPCLPPSAPLFSDLGVKAVPGDPQGLCTFLRRAVDHNRLVRGPLVNRVVLGHLILLAGRIG